MECLHGFFLAPRTKVNAVYVCVVHDYLVVPYYASMQEFGIVFCRNTQCHYIETMHSLSLQLMLVSPPQTH